MKSQLSPSDPSENTKELINEMVGYYGPLTLSLLQKVKFHHNGTETAITLG